MLSQDYAGYEITVSAELVWTLSSAARSRYIASYVVYRDSRLFHQGSIAGHYSAAEAAESAAFGAARTWIDDRDRLDGLKDSR